MNDKKIYVIFLVSLTLNLFFVGFLAFVAGKYVGLTENTFPAKIEHRVDKFHQRQHDHFFHHAKHSKPGQIPMKHGHFAGHNHAFNHDVSHPFMHKNGHHDFRKLPFDHHKKFPYGIICGKADPEIKKLEGEMMKNGFALFKEQMKEDKNIRNDLRKEFAKEKLDTDKIKELFTKQTEGFITIQKNAQNALLELVSKIPADKRSEIICGADKSDAFVNMKPDKHHDAKFKNNSKH